MPFNEITNPIGYHLNAQGRPNAAAIARRRSLLVAALEYIEHLVPEDLILNTAEPEWVDNVVFMVRGNNGAWAHLLWSHMGSLEIANVFIHGKQVRRYNFNMEEYFNFEGMGGTALLVHEFGHTLGSPDFYRHPPTNSTPNNQNIIPMGVWEVMSNQTNPPQSMSAHVKWRYMQWVDEIPIITESGPITLYPNAISKYNHAVRIASPYSDSEHFVIEYRCHRSRTTDSRIPGSGLLIYRVNMRERGSTTPPDELYAYRPNGTLNVNGLLNSAFFSLESGRTMFSGATNPSPFLSDESYGGLIIYNIGSAGESITFNVRIGGANPDDFDESFEDGTFNNFDWMFPDIGWEITNEEFSVGRYSIVTPSIDINETTRMQITIDSDIGYIQFMYKFSTGSGDDVLRLLLNNRVIATIPRADTWSHFFTFLPSGVHTLTWEYSKGSNVEGRVWIDQIGFPTILRHILYTPQNLVVDLADRDINISWDKPFKSNMKHLQPLTLKGYNVYNGLTRLNTDYLTTENFAIPKSAGGFFWFSVVAAYEEGESEKTNQESFQLPIGIPRDLTAELEGNGVRLNWEWDYDISTVLGFRVIRNGVNLTMLADLSTNTTFLDTNIPVTNDYTYTVRTVLIMSGGVSIPSNEATIFVVETDDIINEIPNMTSLLGNFPNPFNPYTNIRFTVGAMSSSTVNMGTRDMSLTHRVRINIYNLRGQRVRTLVDDLLDSGNYEVVWNGRDDSGRLVSSGIYFYRMAANDFEETRKMLLMK